MSTRQQEAYDVGSEEEFALDVFRIFELAGLSVGVVHTKSGWYAIRNRCPHQLAPLCRGVVTGTMLPGPPDQMHFGLAGRVVRCPWHGWEYDLETGKSVFATNRT